MVTSIKVCVIVLFWGMSPPVRTLNIDIMLRVNTTRECTKSVICKGLHADSGQMTVTWRSHPNNLFAATKTVQNIQDHILISASSSCRNSYIITDATEDHNLCSLNCHELFLKYRYMFIDTVCIPSGAGQCYLDNMAINRNYRATFVGVISLILSRQEWSTYIIIASRPQVLTDISSALVSSSYLLITFDGETRINDSLSVIYTLFKEEDLNFIVVCSSTCIDRLLYQALILEAGLKKHSRWLVVPAEGNARELTHDKMHIKTTDVAILEILCCSQHYTLNALILEAGLKKHSRWLVVPAEGNARELTHDKMHIKTTDVAILEILCCSQHYTLNVLKRNDTMASANIYIFHQSRNDTSIVSGGYIDGDENFVLTEELFPGMKYGLNNRTLIVALLKWEPFVYKEVENGSVYYHGVCLDLLTELSHGLNFSYKLVEPEDQEFGQLVDGKWTGMVGMVLKQEADLILGPLLVDAARDTVVDFTTPYFVDNSAVILKQQDVNTNKWKTLVVPFRYEVYICIICSFIFSTVLLYVSEEVNPINKWENNRPSDKWRRYGDILWYHFGALMANGGSYVPKTQTGRSILSCWWFFTVMAAAVYSGNLIAFLTDWREKPPFTTLAEMVEQDTYKWGTQGGTYYINLFQNSTRSDYKKIWHGLVADLTEDPDVLSVDSDVHLRKLLAGHYAFISDLTNLQIWENEHCNLQLLREVFSVLYLAIGLPNNSILTMDFSYQILKIRESGLVDLWFKHWMPLNHCDIPRSAKRVELLALQSAFITAGIGVLLALSILIIEFFYSRSRRAQSPEDTDNEESSPPGQS